MLPGVPSSDEHHSAKLDADHLNEVQEQGDEIHNHFVTIMYDNRTQRQLMKKWWYGGSKSKGMMGMSKMGMSMMGMSSSKSTMMMKSWKGKGKKKSMKEKKSKKKKSKKKKEGRKPEWYWQQNNNMSMNPTKYRPKACKSYES